MGQNLKVFHDTIGYYLGNDQMKYPSSDPNNGYVGESAFTISSTSCP
jgi:hypothetical protein